MKNSIRPRFLILYAFLCLCSFTAWSQSCYNIVGYVPSWQGNNASIDYSKYTHLNYAFGLPNTNGTIGAIDNASKLSDLVSRGHATNTKVILSIGGWMTTSPDNTPFESIANNSSYINTFVNACANLVTQYNLDGIDIDWEYPSSQTKWNNVMNPLATRIHGMGKLLTAAVPGGAWAGDRVGNLSILDLVNIMSYDCNCPTNAPYSEAVNNLNYWASRGVPVSKRILGVPFYSSDNYTSLHVQKANYVKAGNGGGIMIWEITSPGDINAIASTLGTLCKGGTPPPTCNAVNLPSTIQAEAYCDMSGVQLENTSDSGGGQNVGWIDANDWMHYKVNVPSTGTYTVQYRVASQSGGGSIRLEPYGGGTAYGTISVPSTGGWQTWTTISQTVTLSAGARDIAIVAVAGGFNINWVNISGGGSNPGFSQTVQAESYTQMSGIQTESTSDTGGGLNVGWIDTNDWMKYDNINVPSTGAYKFEYRVASPNSTGVLSQDLNSGTIQLGTIAIPNTGGWQNWTTISRTVNLNAGTYNFGIFASAGGWNLNWWKISSSTGARIASSEDNVIDENSLAVYPNPSQGTVTIRVAEPSHVSILDISGKVHFSSHVEESVTVDNLNTGLYIVKMNSNSRSKAAKLIVK